MECLVRQGEWHLHRPIANGVSRTTAPVVFDDAAGKIAILLREKIGKSKKVVNLICLYDKKSGKASIAEYQWLGQ